MTRTKVPHYSSTEVLTPASEATYSHPTDGGKDHPSGHDRQRCLTLWPGLPVAEPLACSARVRPKHDRQTLSRADEPEEEVGEGMQAPKVG